MAMLLLLFNNCFESVRDVHYISHRNELLGNRHILDVRQLSPASYLCVGTEEVLQSWTLDLQFKKKVEPSTTHVINLDTPAHLPSTGRLHGTKKHCNEDQRLQ
jgi:hypothetical protein